MSFRRLPATIAASVVLVCLFQSCPRAWAESGITNIINAVTTNYLDTGAVTNWSGRFYRVRVVP